MHPDVRQPDPGSCPKCGMALERVSPAPVQTREEWTCPMHPEIVRAGPGTCPICGMALERRTVVDGRGPRSGARRHDAAILDQPHAGGSAPRHRHGRHDPRRTAPPSCSCAPAGVGAAGAGHARGPLGRLAVLRPRLALARESQPQHVHAHRPRHRARLRLQRGGRRRARHLPGVLPLARGRGRPLLRSGRGDHRAGAARPGAGAARAEPDERGHQGAARPGAQDGAPAPRGWLRGGRSAGARPARRPSARPPGRESARGRRGAGGCERRRRVHGDGRVDPRRESARPPCDRRHRQRHRAAS